MDINAFDKRYSLMAGFQKNTQCYTSDDGKQIPLFFILDKISIKKLQGLKNCEIEITEPLTAIMGVNGVGKSTVLHALACSFQPDNRPEVNEEDKRDQKNFPYFFPPTTDHTWKDSEFDLRCHWVGIDGNRFTAAGKTVNTEYHYSKDFDRWKPRYKAQPFRAVRYIGIDTCTPEIEKYHKPNAPYRTSFRNDKESKEILKAAATILNMDYEDLTENRLDKITLSGVTRKSSLRYTTLTMGAGEQRLLYILETIYKAPRFSLILIDEIDLLMHPDALKNTVISLLGDCFRPNGMRYLKLN